MIQKCLSLFHRVEVKFFSIVVLLGTVSVILTVFLFNANTEPALPKGENILLAAEWNLDKMELESPEIEDKNYHYIPQSYEIDASLIERATSKQINPKMDEYWKKLNMDIYNIANKYMIRATNIPEECRNPLMLLAIANLETGIYADFNLLYAPAIPTIGIENWTDDIIYTYGSAEVLRNVEYWDRLVPYSAKHQGPLQMGVNYGVSISILEEDLREGEADINMLSYWYSDKYQVPNSWITPQMFPAGDRYNWADACNRTVGVWNSLSSVYNREVDNRYEMAALLALSHNVGSIIFLKNDEYRPNLSFFPWDTVGNARDYVKSISTPEVLQSIRKVVKEDVESWRNKEKYIPYSGRGHSWGFSMIPKEAEEYFTLKGDYKNRLGYPIRMIYMMMLLEEVYGGG